MSTQCIQLNEDTKTWLKSTPIFPENFTLELRANGGAQKFKVLDRGEDGFVDGVSNRVGHKGFVLKVQPEGSEVVRAAKFAVLEDYDATRTEADEQYMAEALRNSNGLFLILGNCGRVTVFEGMPKQASDKFVCFISDWVDGKSLETYFHNCPDMITPHFIINVSKKFNMALNYLRSKNLKHDDLHPGNLMIKAKDSGLILNESDKSKLDIIVIDNGSLKPMTQETDKAFDDMLHFTKSLVDMYNIIQKGRRYFVENPAFSIALRQLIDNLLSNDLQRTFPNLHHDINSTLDNIGDLIGRNVRDKARLLHPFEAISAEHLANDEMLVSLFVKKLPWMEDMETRMPIVLTGPRGCGKSMLFRYLSIKTHLSGQSDALSIISELPFFGVYISCATELQNSMSWIAHYEDKMEKLSEKIITFFNIIVVRELFKTLAMIQKDHTFSVKYDMRDSIANKIIQLINGYLPDGWIRNRLNNTPVLWQAAESLDLLRIQLHSSLINRRDCNDIRLPENFLGEVSDCLANNSHYFSNNPVAFLLDDYTSYRVPVSVQKVLNKIVFERRPNHIFKISCEKYGYVTESGDGMGIDEDREYAICDTGSYFLDNALSNESREFIEEFLDLRLQNAEWKGRVGQLIGDSDSKTYIALARKIYNQKLGAGKKAPLYYGLHILSDLWSGDIATTLHIVRTMFNSAKLDATSIDLISHKVQDESIRRVSNSYMQRIDVYHPYGKEMLVILKDFGTLVSDVLKKGALIKNKKSDLGDPRMMPRLEKTINFGENFLEEIEKINPEASKIAKQLLRRAIFLELPPSKAKEPRSIGTVRWHLRKIYLPSFEAALGKNHYFDVKTYDHFVKFLVNSSEFSKSMKNCYIQPEEGPLLRSFSVAGEKK